MDSDFIQRKCLCCTCDRTGVADHLRYRHVQTIPREIMPCSWIMSGGVVTPTGAEYAERLVSNNHKEPYKSCCITKCPLYINRENGVYPKIYEAREGDKPNEA